MNELLNFHTVRGYEMLEKEHKLLTSSMEDYLEMIYRKSRDSGYTRINELAQALNVHAPSATKMVQKLTKLGLIKYKKYGIIQLTEKGEQTGEFLINRHIIIENFLNKIGLEDNVLINIELMEHNITDSALEKIQLLNKYFEENPEAFDKYKAFISTKKEHL